MAQQRLELVQLVQMQLRQACDGLFAGPGQLHPHHSAVAVVLRPVDEPGRLGAVDELHGAVVSKEQVLRDLADGRPAPAVVALYRQEQLVLRGGQAGRLGLLLAPPVEPAQRRTEGQQGRVVGLPRGCHRTMLAKMDVGGHFGPPNCRAREAQCFVVWPAHYSGSRSSTAASPRSVTTAGGPSAPAPSASRIRPRRPARSPDCRSPRARCSCSTASPGCPRSCWQRPCCRTPSPGTPSGPSRTRSPRATSERCSPVTWACSAGPW